MEKSVNSKKMSCNGTNEKDIMTRIQEAQRRVKQNLAASRSALGNQDPESMAKMAAMMSMIYAPKTPPPKNNHPPSDSKSINISDLYLDNTVWIKSMTDGAPLGEEQDISRIIQNQSKGQGKACPPAVPQKPVLNKTCAAPTSKNQTVEEILQSSRSQKVRRLSSQMNQPPNLSSFQSSKLSLITDSIQNLSTEEIFHQGEELLKKILDKDEENFKVPEIPANFSQTSPPKIRSRSANKNSSQCAKNCTKDMLTVELDGLPGTGFLCNTTNINDFSLNSYCNKRSENLDNIVRPDAEQQQQCRKPSQHEDVNLIDVDQSMACCNISKPVQGNVTRIAEALKNVKDGDTTQYLIEKLIADESVRCNLTNPNVRPPDECLIEKFSNEEPSCSKNDVPKKCSVTSTVCANFDLNKTMMERFVEEKKAKYQQCEVPSTNKCQPQSCNIKAIDNKPFNCSNKACEPASCEIKCEMPTACVVELPNCNIPRSREGSTVSVFSSNGCSAPPINMCELKRSSSQMSSLSEFNYLNGYLPLKSTHNEISWASVKLRKAVIKSFQVKNTACKRLVVRVILDGPGFQFENPEANQKGTITLQPNEVRSMSIVFNPTVIGPAVGNLIFQPPVDLNPNEQCATMSTISSNVTKRVIRLYGYGGHVNIMFDNLQQGPVGSKFLPLGNLCHLQKVFDGSFIIRNKGPLSGFASIMLESKTVGKSFFDNSITINPDKVIVPPNGSVQININFTPNCSDLKEMIETHRNSEVITIGNLLMITGDEPTRCRIKRLIANSKEMACKYTAPQLQSLWADFGCMEDCSEMNCLKETGNALSELLCCFQTKEVALTVNNSTTDISLLDASGWLNDYDESTEFHTIFQPDCNAACTLLGGNNACDRLVEDEDGCGFTKPCGQKEEWWVEPAVLEFDMNSDCAKKLMIHSKVTKDMMFEVDSNVANYFSVSPQEGVLRPHNSPNQIFVRMINYSLPSCPLYIHVFIENDRLTIPVHVNNSNCLQACPVSKSASCSNKNLQCK